MSVKRKLFVLVVVIVLLASVSFFVEWDGVNNTSKQAFIEYVELESFEKQAIQHGIGLSKEFSFKLVNTELKPRTAKLNEMLGIIGRVYGSVFSFIPTVENSNSSTRREWGYSSLKDCGLSQIIIRTRQYSYGADNNTSTLDIKKSFPNPEKTSIDEFLSEEFYPTEDVPNYYIHQKFEEDVHVCSRKYSRETRIKQLEYDFILENCGDVARVYPKLKVLRNSYKTPLEKRYPHPWYVVRHNGIANITIDGATLFYEYESTITMQYYEKYTNEQIFYDGDELLSTSKSEYSIKIRAPDDGLSAWPKAILDLHFELFDRVRRELGSFVAEDTCEE